MLSPAPSGREVLIPAADGRLLAATLDAGAAKIGHHGFFRAEFRDRLWRPAADWLDEGVRPAFGSDIVAPTRSRNGVRPGSSDTY